MQLNDKQIRQLVEDQGMIVNFVDKQKQDGVISYGLDSCGYDIRIQNVYKAPTYLLTEIDVKNRNTEHGYQYKTAGDNRIVIPPHSAIMVASVEEFNLPRNVCAHNNFGKSTYARYGLVCNMTPIEPGYKGGLTFGLINTTHLPFVVYANEGIAQLTFHFVEDVETSYADKGGKYQGSKGVTAGKVVSSDKTQD